MEPRFYSNRRNCNLFKDGLNQVLSSSMTIRQRSRLKSPPRHLLNLACDPGRNAVRLKPLNLQIQRDYVKERPVKMPSLKFTKGLSLRNLRSKEFNGSLTREQVYKKIDQVIIDKLKDKNMLDKATFGLYNSSLNPYCINTLNSDFKEYARSRSVVRKDKSGSAMSSKKNIVKSFLYLSMKSRQSIRLNKLTSSSKQENNTEANESANKNESLFKNIIIKNRISRTSIN
eukprot:TRINITY_DN7766_c0_g1_i4.p1 TRINITY_DN7766_c0_g1~~TRINITY_DN7766_c0_g1_i4.p1  ORF type:complete len:229 (-),score=33.53 TRINITY_DN7766_c0_g1_i4:164-850(-)